MSSTCDDELCAVVCLFVGNSAALPPQSMITGSVGRGSGLSLQWSAPAAAARGSSNGRDYPTRAVAAAAAVLASGELLFCDVICLRHVYS